MKQTAHTCAHMHILYRAWSKCVRWCSQHLSNIHTCTCMVLNNTCEYNYTLRKIHMHSCMRAYATVQKLLCHESYCELILSLAQASCRLSFAACPPPGSTKSVARRCLLKKCVQICANSWRSRYCGIAQASSHHQHWYMPHPVCPCVALPLGHRVYPSQKSIFAIFHASFSCLWLSTGTCLLHGGIFCDTPNDRSLVRRRSCRGGGEAVVSTSHSH